MQPRRILFVIRGKLGDSLIPFGMARAYADAYPQDDISLLIRKDYAHLLKNERGMRLIPFGSRIEMTLRLIWMRFTEPGFDVLAVLWGFGKPVVRIARLALAKRKIYMDSRYAEAYGEWPAPAPYEYLVDPSWRVVTVFVPEIARPDKLEIPSLMALRKQAPRPGVIGVVPAADEDRRTFDLATLRQLLGEVGVRHPDKKVWLIINPHDRGAREFLAAPIAPNCEVKTFSSLATLLSIIVQLDAYYGTDTGLYHLAAAMGVPATVMFGPTQPQRIIMPRQPGATWVRLQVLGASHCEIKDCAKPLCVYQCVASFAHAVCATPLEATPPACPLRSFGAAALPAITVCEPALS